MKYKGKMYWWESGEEKESSVEAVISGGKISIDWTEPGMGRGHLESFSPSGRHFQGNYGYPRAEQEYFFDLQRYESGEEIMLFGVYRDSEAGDEGKWIIVLKPEKAD
jgi:hypothetical protein